MKSTNESQHSTPGTADNEVAPHKHTVIFTPRWAVIIGILAIGFLYLALPESLTFGPNWLLLAIEAVLLIPLLFIGITIQGDCKAIPGMRPPAAIDGK